MSAENNNPSDHLGDRPKSRLSNGKRNPEYSKWYSVWYRQQHPDSVRKWNQSEGYKAAALKYAEKKRCGRIKRMKADGHLRLKIASMLNDGWKEDTIVTVLGVPQSIVKSISESLAR